MHLNKNEIQRRVDWAVEAGYNPNGPAIQGLLTQQGWSANIAECKCKCMVEQTSSMSIATNGAQNNSDVIM